MTAPHTREFDIVVYGATGYTGRLVAEYLVQEYGGRPGAPKWAMAGRNAGKLAEVRDAIGAPADTPLIVAASDDTEALARMSDRTRVVLTTVGPYQYYGEPLVSTCAEHGTDYVDLCGEPLWMRDMIDRHDAAARRSGARIIFSGGFDSVPFDLGVLMLQNEAMKRFGIPAPRVKGRVRVLKGRFSGGTAASLEGTYKVMTSSPSLAGRMRSPFALTPGFEGPAQPAADAPAFDQATGSWAAPFVMAEINVKNVHRTNFLLGHPWGRDFVYDEMILTGPGEQGEAIARHIAATPMIGHQNDPKPGEGPSAEERRNGRYDVLFVGEWPDGRTLRYAVKGRYDPGYGSTSRMIAEAGIDLLSSATPGGIGTPGAILGSTLVERLRDHAEMQFAPED
ncbi:trans-acting enoyl reductase family protein [Sphingobium sp. EM0848]|uniref:saccharopine dehydrogenase family protein n=1 Tax=Sphingobium sp. EM0848 TaxID=2743473 RepID=UPI00159C5D28|nr:saccharopine dehydrogenase NADP-binding domain-containing protein [Sphingobium sp. EM0848]